MKSPEDVGPDLPDILPSSEIAKYSGQDREYYKSIVRMHRQEYFADLVSVAYVGEAILEFLKEFIPNNKVSPSHPSSAARFKIIEDFINKTNNPIVNLFQDALDSRGFSPLTRQFQSIDVDDSFANVRPCQINSDQEVFGIFESGWKFFKRMIDNPSELWKALSEDEIERITNDLIEKSIRNRMILEGWNETTNP